MKNLPRRIRRLIARLYLDRCECGRIIWPWQQRAVDSDLGMFIHLECGDPGPDLRPTRTQLLEQGVSIELINLLAEDGEIAPEGKSEQ